MKISFIIPAYNARQYLKDCLDSIFALDLKECEREVIVVDDGSTDHTASLLQEYGQVRDLHVIHQENKGLSVARNVGLNAAEGDYICFVDADDRVSPVEAKSLLSSMNQGIDLIGINVHEVKAGGKRSPYRRYVPEYDRVYRRAEEFMRGRNLFPCVWGYLFRKELLDKQQLRFYPGIYHEDEEFTPRVFAVAESFMALNIDWYERVLRPESITTTTDLEKQHKKLRDMLFVLKRLDAIHCESMQCKLDWLAVDILRLLFQQNHSHDFSKEVVGELRLIGYFPLHWHWTLKYSLFNLLTRLVFFNF